jgi:hypothetical protein
MQLDSDIRLKKNIQTTTLGLEFLNKLNDCLNELPENWDGIHLGGSSPLGSTVNYSLFLNKCFASWGGYGYIVNKKAIPIILDKIKGSLITIIGNTAQVMTTAIFGMYGLLAFVASIDYNVYQYWKPIALFFLIVQLVAIFFFLRIRLVSSFLNKISFLKKFEKHIAVFKAYSQSQLFKVLVFSFLRYVVFSLQYVLLLYFFIVQIGLIKCNIGAIVLFCIQSVVPSFILLDIGLRGASALFVFNELSNFDKSIELGVLLSAYTLWIINLLIPSLFGLYIILKHKFTLE